MINSIKTVSFIVTNANMTQLQTHYVDDGLKSLMNVTSFLDARYKNDFLETSIKEFNNVNEELSKNVILLEYKVEEKDILPLPA